MTSHPRVVPDPHEEACGQFYAVGALAVCYALAGLVAVLWGWRRSRRWA